VNPRSKSGSGFWSGIPGSARVFDISAVDGGAVNGGVSEPNVSIDETGFGGPDLVGGLGVEGDTLLEVFINSCVCEKFVLDPEFEAGSSYFLLVCVDGTGASSPKVTPKARSLAFDNSMICASHSMNQIH
jgi:hypothetical protein